MAVNPDASILVRINAERSAATIIVPDDFDPGMMDVALLAVLVRDRDVTVDADVQRTLEQIVATFRSGPRAIEQIVARATPAVAGTDGRLEWLEGFDPNAPRSVDEAEDRDHYSGVDYVSVTAGTHVATLHAPTAGQDGRDVTGRVLKARPGRPAPVRFGDGVLVDAASRVVVQADGVLVQTGGTVDVSQLLVISGPVDFSTGNIDFDGSVIVRGNVCSRFRIRATGDVTVEGLIEAATIECGGDFHGKSGMAGQDRGSITVGGTAHVKYLNAVTGRVRGDLLVENEVLGCTLVVDGCFKSVRGSILGGSVTITGSIQVETIGAEAEPATTLILGEVPRLECELQDLRRRRMDRAAELERHGKQEQTLTRIPSKQLTAEQKEQITMLHFERNEIQTMIDACDERILEIETELVHARTVDVEVLNAIHPKVVLEVREDRVRFDELARGPLRIGWGPSGALEVKRAGGQARPISSVARALPRAA